MVNCNTIFSIDWECIFLVGLLKKNNANLKNWCKRGDHYCGQKSILKENYFFCVHQLVNGRGIQIMHDIWHLKMTLLPVLAQQCIISGIYLNITNCLKRDVCHLLIFFFIGLRYCRKILLLMINVVKSRSLFWMKYMDEMLVRNQILASGMCFRLNL